MRASFFLIFSLLLNLTYAQDILSDLKLLENKYNIDLSNLSYKLKEDKNNPKLINILKDSKGTLRKTDADNFFLFEEKTSIKMFKDQMKSSGGSRVGNGGDVIVCHDTTEVLDSYKAKNYASDSLSILDDIAIDDIIKKLNTTIPHLGKSLEQFIANFKQRESFNDQVYWSPEEELINIHDEELMSKLPKDCSLVQAVVRFKTKRKVYFYNKKIFKKLPADQLSWILVHEWLWDYLKSSSDIREVNHFLHSVSFRDYNESEILNFLKRYEFNLKEGHLFSVIASKKEVAQQVIEKLLEEIQVIETDLDAQNLILNLSRKISKIDFSINLDEDFILKVDSLFNNLRIYITQRIQTLEESHKSALELQVLKDINTIFSGKELDQYDKILLIDSYSSILKIRMRTQSGIAKIYIQDRFWHLFPSVIEKRLIQMEILDKKLYNQQITINDYLVQLFKIFKVKMPSRFKNL